MLTLKNLDDSTPFVGQHNVKTGPATIERRGLEVP
jgi:hypothetical protein